MHEVPGLEPQAVRFVNSLGLGEELRPSRFAGSWRAHLVCASSSTRTRPGRWRWSTRSHPQALDALYDHVLAAFPDAYLEDPHDLPEIAHNEDRALGPPGSARR
jgi:hypothetical protein